MDLDSSEKCFRIWLPRFDDLKELINYASNIIDSMTNEDDISTVNDWVKLSRIREKLLKLFDLFRVETDFVSVLFEMDKMKISEEDSKWSFPSEKFFKTFRKKIILDDIEQLVDISKSWRFDDYRSQNFQNELRQKMEVLREIYKKDLIVGCEEVDGEDRISFSFE